MPKANIWPIGLDAGMGVAGAQKNLALGEIERGVMGGLVGRSIKSSVYVNKYRRFDISGYVASAWSRCPVKRAWSVSGDHTECAQVFLQSLRDTRLFFRRKTA